MLSRHRQWLLIIFMAAALLRLGGLGAKSLWFDEAYSAMHSQQPQATIWSRLGARPETHPPLYYSGLHYWMQAVGTSETAVRLPSALMSLLNLGLLYALGRRLFNRRVALLAMGLLALSPLDLWYAQEARMYIFMTGVVLAAALLLTWQRWAALPALTAVLALGLYLDYTLPPLWAALSAVWLVYWRQSGGARRPFLIWLLAAPAAWLLYQPWAPYFLDVLNELNDIHFFIRLQEVTGLPPLSGAGYLLVMALGGIGLALAAAWAQPRLRQARVQRWLTPLIIVGFALLTALMPIPRLYGVKRLLVQGWPLIILLVAWLLEEKRGTQRGTQSYAEETQRDAEKFIKNLCVPPRLRGSPRSSLLTLLIVSLAASLVTLVAVPKDDWRTAVAALNARADETAVVWIAPHWNQLAYRYYQPHIAPRSGDEAALRQAAGEDLWLVAERFPSQTPPTSPSEAWLDQERRLVETIPLVRLELRRYVKGEE